MNDHQLTEPNRGGDGRQQYAWTRHYAGLPVDQTHDNTPEQEEIRRLKAELRRVTEERDILKMVAALVYA